MVDPNKKKADGFCMACGGEVPQSHSNLFYCKKDCMDVGQDHFSNSHKYDKELIKDLEEHHNEQRTPG